mmetsp:Transcript_32901/g.50308  ORF Transcript_32901/g.50308 Transcript_32901/m.50308 type:complete len:186 (-) Transcript_32901:508-1065(-)
MAPLVRLLILLQLVFAAEKTCTISQKCKRDDPSQTLCPDPRKIDNPIIEYFEPATLSSPFGIMAICPFLNATEPLCCNDDQVAIMTENYKQIDSVFGGDCPLCAVNLKKLWCEYTCDPKKTDFVKGLGYKEIEMNGHMQNMTEVFFSVDEDMSCTVFQSCKKTSLIAQASLQSSISFLDFMGVNG